MQIDPEEHRCVLHSDFVSATSSLLSCSSLRKHVEIIVMEIAAVIRRPHSRPIFRQID